MRKILLVCGLLSSLLYTTMLVVVPSGWPGYSSASQAISELSAIGAPTRTAWAVPGSLYTVFMVAFGWGIWRYPGGRRALRFAGALITAYGALGLIWPFAPMHMRDAIAAGGGTFSDTLHLILSGATVALMLAAMVAGAAALDMRFRLYTIASLLTQLVFGALTFADAPRIAAGLPTPYLGVWERIDVGVFLLWIAVLSVVVWKLPATASRPFRSRPAAA